MTPTLTERLICSLTDAQRLQLIRDHDALERDGFIGESELRSRAEELMHQFGDAGHIVMWMERLAFEAYRFYARRYIDRYGQQVKLTGDEPCNPCAEIKLSEGMECVLLPPEEESKP